MITWDLLKEYEKKPPKSSSTYRTKNVNDAYKIHKSRLKQQNITLSQHIIKSVFNNNPNEIIKLESNSFPYFIEDNVKHYLLWLNPLVKHTNINLLDHIPYQFNKYKDENIAIISNTKEARSIPEIDHIHIFIRDII
jgi:hypothetical protein